MVDEDYEWIEGEDFEDWLKKNEKQIADCLRWDSYELLYQAWFAGYGHGLDKGCDMFMPFSGAARKG